MTRSRFAQIASFAIVFLLTGSLVILVRQLQKPQLIAPRAAPEETPRDIRITNLTENSAAVSWITTDSLAGIIKYGTDPSRLDKTGSEDDGRSPSTVHHITLKPLKPETTYYFRLQSGLSIFDDSGKPFTVTTPKVISTPPPPQTIYGSILPASGSSLADRAIVYVDIPNSSTPLSTLVNPDSGNWSLSISTVRAAGGNNYLAVADSTILKIFVQGGNQGTAAATINLPNSTPVPSISFGQTYTFEKLTAQTEPKTASESAQTQTVAQTLTAAPAPNEFTAKPNLTPTEINLSVTNIKDGQTLTDTSPTFIGTAPPAIKITVTVQSPASYSAEITVKSDGSWTWTPPADLTPGSHAITITYTDAAGQTHTETKTFLVQSASVSATPIPTVSEQQLPAAGNFFPTAMLLLLGIFISSSGVLLVSKRSPAS